MVNSSNLKLYLILTLLEDTILLEVNISFWSKLKGWNRFDIELRLKLPFYSKSSVIQFVFRKIVTI